MRRRVLKVSVMATLALLVTFIAAGLVLVAGITHQIEGFNAAVMLLMLCTYLASSSLGKVIWQK